MKLVSYIIIFLSLMLNGNAQEKAIILKNVNVVDVVQGNIRKGQDIVIKKGIIQAIGKNIGERVSGEARDLTGMYVMPGLIDAHVHIANDPKESRESRAKHLEYFLRHGITSIRDAAGDARVLRELKEAYNRGNTWGLTSIMRPLWQDLPILKEMTGRKAWWKAGLNLTLLGCSASVRIVIWIKRWRM